MSYALPFDTYLIDNTPAAGDPVFKEKCLAMLNERRRPPHHLRDVGYALGQAYCEAALLIANQGLVYYSDIDEAILEPQQSEPQRGLTPPVRLPQRSQNSAGRHPRIPYLSDVGSREACRREPHALKN